MENNDIRDYNAAQEWAQNRVNIATCLNSKQLTKRLPPEIATNAFFVSECTKANVTSEIRSILDKYKAGEMSLGQAKDAMVSLAGREPGQVPKRILTTGRINQIVQHEVTQADAIGTYEVSFDPEIMEQFPSLEYSSVEDSFVRPEHRAFHGKVFLKTDPIWDTIFPPWDFGCRCFVYDSEKRPKGHTKIRARRNSGYRFHPRFGFRKLPTGELAPIDQQKIIDNVQKFVEKEGFMPADVEIITKDKDGVEKRVKLGGSRAKSTSKKKKDVQKVTIEKRFPEADVNYHEIPKSTIEKMESTILKLNDKYPQVKLKTIGSYKAEDPRELAQAHGALIEIAEDFAKNPSMAEPEYSKKFMDKRQADFEQDKLISSRNIKFYEERLKNARSIEEAKFYKKQIKNEKQYIKDTEFSLKFKRHNVIYKGKEVESTIAHEYGHALADTVFGQLNGHHRRGDPSVEAKKCDIVRDVFSKSKENGNIFKLSKYAARDPEEFFAEAFAMREMGVEKLPIEIENMLNEVLK